MNCQHPPSVLQGLREGNLKAFECLAKRCFPVFQNYARNRCARNHEDIEDIYQDCLYRLLLELQKPDFAPDDVFAHFYTMLRNRCSAIARKNGRMPTDELNRDIRMEGDDDQPAYTIKDYCECMRQLFEKNKRAWLVIIHRDAEYFEEFPHRKEGTCFEGVEHKTDEQLREELGYEDIRAVRVLRSRWREKLKDCLKQKMLNRE